MAANDYSSQQQPDDISLFLQQILLPSSSSSQRHQSSQPQIVTPTAPSSCSFRMPYVGNSEIEVDECDYESEEAVEETGAKAMLSRSCSKRSRAAEVHNLSEKRRRSRINEKMKALQNLIPNSNKTDKASMLDEAIEYLKQLQLQVQMLTMRNGLSLYPICLPGMLQPNLTQDVYDSDKFLNVNLTKAICMDQNISAPLTDFPHAIGSNSSLEPQSSMQQQHHCGALQLTESSKVLPSRPVIGDDPQSSSGGVKATASVPCETQTSNLKGYSLEGVADQTYLITQYFHPN